MQNISDELLFEVYTRAIELRLSTDFISLIDEEIDKRIKKPSESIVNGG
ncbi:sporulation histidine kinase inhibitor Sda [Neobacillus niacini]